MEGPTPSVDVLGVHSESTPFSFGGEIGLEQRVGRGSQGSRRDDWRVEGLSALWAGGNIHNVSMLLCFVLFC